MKAVVIGGYGHIGRHLVPKLIADGCEVTVVTRGRQSRPDALSWQGLGAEHLTFDYAELVGSAAGTKALAELQPHVVIDILGHDTPVLMDALPPTVKHVVLCGSLWMYGPPRQVPTAERTQGQCPFDAYRKRYQQLQQVLSRGDGPTVAAVMPTNIAGAGKIPLEPAAGRSIDVHRAMAGGSTMTLPGDGSTLVGPIDADDVAEVFRLVLRQPERADGQMYNAGAAYAVTFSELVAVYGDIYGRKLPVEYMNWPAFEARFKPDLSTRYHFQQHMCADITKARLELGYRPRYTPQDALARAVAWMRQSGLLA
jgi:nucleoside-diphosphate-sugar epimerase